MATFEFEPDGAYQIVGLGRVSVEPLGIESSVGSIERARSKMRLPPACNAILDGDRVIDEVQPARCCEPSEFYAKDNFARYGHVCRECWEGFDEPEREQYAERRFELSSALYGKLGSPNRLPGGEP